MAIPDMDAERNAARNVRYDLSRVVTRWNGQTDYPEFERLVVRIKKILITHDTHPLMS